MSAYDTTDDADLSVQLQERFEALLQAEREREHLPEQPLTLEEPQPAKRPAEQPQWAGLAAVAPPDEDLAELHRRFDDLGAAVSALRDEVAAARRSPSAPPSAPAEAGARDPGVAELNDQLDELRRQLEAAFSEVDQGFAAVSARLDAMVESAAAGEAGQAALGRGLRAVHDLVAQQTASLGTPSPHLAALAEALERVVVASSHDLANRIDSLAGPTTPHDLASVTAGLEQKLAAAVEGVAGQVEQLGAQTREELAALHQDLRSGSTGKVDTTSLEAAFENAALRLAADVADARRDVVRLGRVAEAQQGELRELRATLEWIKERLLLR